MYNRGLHNHLSKVKSITSIAAIRHILFHTFERIKDLLRLNTIQITSNWNFPYNYLQNHNNLNNNNNSNNSNNSNNNGNINNIKYFNNIYELFIIIKYVIKIIKFMNEIIIDMNLFSSIELMEKVSII